MHSRLLIVRSCYLLSCFNRFAVVTLEECQTRGKQGLCKHVQDCSYAQTLIKNQQNPDICDFEGLDAIVCCPLEEKLPSPIIKLPLLSRPGQNEHKTLSEIKCEQFYPIPKFPILVIGGTKSLAKEFPHMAIIGFGEATDKQWQCGGSLISMRFVLTAAHCLDSLELGPAKWIRLGDLDLSSTDDIAEPQDFFVKRRIYHPNYDHPSRYNDIGLLELDRLVSLSMYVSPACLHVTKELPTPKMTATGWGKKGFIDGYSSYLQKIDLNHVDIGDCRDFFANVSRRFLSSGILEETQICAGGVVGQDTCQGDSGGPLQIINYKRSFAINVYNLIGITSFGKACGLSSSPGVYTRVSSHVPWIESIVWPNETWDKYEPVDLFNFS